MCPPFFHWFRTPYLQFLALDALLSEAFLAVAFLFCAALFCASFFTFLQFLALLEAVAFLFSIISAFLLGTFSVFHSRRFIQKKAKSRVIFLIG